MINSIPILGWLMSLFFSVSMSVPFWFIWTNLGIGAKYFGWLPAQYQAIPFWDVVGLVIVASILKSILLPRLSCSCDHKGE